MVIALGGNDPNQLGFFWILSALLRLYRCDSNKKRKEGDEAYFELVHDFRL
jgi:hypothetical protein